jgi:2-octaprenyl-6-methoxyphenol hydroxylase
LNDEEQRVIEELMHDFGARAGTITHIADRRIFPLVLEYARDIVGRRCVVLGNAAQTLHPVAGQGFNLGLRDAFELREHLVDTPRERIGEPATLDRYAASRRRDRMAGIKFTNGLVSVFGSDVAALRWTRGLALTLLDALPLAKRAFNRAMLFGF